MFLAFVHFRPGGQPMRTLALAGALLAVIGLSSLVTAEPRMVLIEEFTNTS